MTLPNKAYYFVADDSGAPMQLGDSHQDGNGWFPNQETATAAAQAACAQDPTLVLHVVYGTRSVVANVTGATQVTVTPV